MEENDLIDVTGSDAPEDEGLEESALEADLTVSGGDSVLDDSVSSDLGSDLVETGASYDLYYSAVYNAVSDAIVTSQEVTDGQIVNSTALTYFEGILANQLLPCDYVIYVGQPYTYNSNGYERTAYEYCMAYGDLDVSGTYFTGEGATIVTMRTSGSVSVEYAENQSVSLSAPMYYSRSNLGNYSGIIDFNYEGGAILFLLCIGGLIWFMRKIFGFKF